MASVHQPELLQSDDAWEQKTYQGSDAMTPVLYQAQGEGQNAMTASGSERPVPSSSEGEKINDLSALVKPTLTEFVGTALFVFVGVMSVVNASAGKSPQTPMVHDNVPLAHGLAIFIIVTVTGHVSGGHLNPAVSWGVFLSGNIGFLRTIAYWIAQVWGGVVGTALVLAISPQLAECDYAIQRPLLTNITENITIFVHGEPVNLGLVVVQPPITVSQAVLLEAFATAVLVLTVLCVAVSPSGPNQLAPLCIGMAVTAGIYAISHLTGASMNPARSFGPAIVSFDALTRNPRLYPNEGGEYYETFWKYQWIYWLGPLAGATAAAIIYRLLLTSEPQQKLRARNIQ